ncbi:WhiB family transcriptional regulator [Nocardiopsis sp. CNT312]|uniref:WhiB family transcriptional regulator n=1 Tax=Nocardiopsis sp. CNT312 TaxID=1137268 RepID=UPI00048FFB7B|nr:WhiB family transcriptional regulator [Nocardiopsis sp. CNT312]
MGDAHRRRRQWGTVAAPTPVPRPMGGSGAVGADGPRGGPARPEPRGGGWQAHAACRGMDPDLWFPAQGGAVRAAKRVCRACPVQVNCLAEAMRRGEPYGVWGGASEEERRRFRAARRDERRARGGGAGGWEHAA